MFPVHRLLTGEQVADLDVEDLLPPPGEEVHLLGAAPPDLDLVAPGAQLGVNDVLQDDLDVGEVVEAHGGAQTVVDGVVLLVRSQDRLPRDVPPRHPRDEVGADAEVEVVQDGVHADGPPLALEVAHD